MMLKSKKTLFLVNFSDSFNVDRMKILFTAVFIRVKMKWK